MHLTDDLVAGAGFLWRLPAFLRHPVSLDEARAILHRRLERRAADFLGLAQRAIYGNPQSPYRQLLALAGCEYGDLERMVGQDGLEEALRRLYRAGVYLTVDEFKGRRPVIRGHTTIAADAGLLRNPHAAPHVPTQTGASRGRGTLIALDLATIRDRAVNALLTLDARGGGKWGHAYWWVPGGYTRLVLRHACAGARLARWFSQVDPAAPGVDARYCWSARAMRWESALLGVSLPRVEYVPLEHPLPIVRWMSDMLRARGTPHLYTYVSPAVRLCRAALEAGVDLEGAQLTVAGELLTEARLAVLRRAGVETRVYYGSVDAGGFLSYGCLAPGAAERLARPAPRAPVGRSARRRGRGRRVPHGRRRRLRSRAGHGAPVA